jgi:hypothetical protein
MSDAPPEGEPPAGERVHPVSRVLGVLLNPVALTWALGVVAVGLGGVDLVHRRDQLFSWEGFFGFHAWFGFAAFSVIVLMGWPLRRLLARPESYYGEDDEDA